LGSATFPSKYVKIHPTQTPKITPTQTTMKKIANEASDKVKQAI